MAHLDRPQSNYDSRAVPSAHPAPWAFPGAYYPAPPPLPAESYLPHIPRRGYLPPLPPAPPALLSRVPDPAIVPPPPPPQRPPQVRKRVSKPANSYQIPVIPGVKPFVTKVRYMVTHPREFGHVVTWSTDGESVLVDFGNPDVLANDVLPRVFNHSNAGAFTRQFTNYGFVTLKGHELVLALAGPLPATTQNVEEEIEGGDESGDISVNDHDQLDETLEDDDDDGAGDPSTSAARRRKKKQDENEDDTIDDNDDAATTTTSSVRSPTRWKAFRHAHSAADLVAARAQEREDAAAAASAIAGIRPHAVDNDNDDADDEGEQEDGNWFARDGMNDLKLLKRLKPSTGTGDARAGRRKRGTPTTTATMTGIGGGRVGDDDHSGGGGGGTVGTAGTKKARPSTAGTMLEAVAGSSSGGGPNPATRSTIGGVEMTGRPA
ncbi:hypothetical protein JCM11491_002478 [Sporobolomyces phaffii]